MLQPRYGLYLVVLLTLAGDNILLPWYPFNKNFSSPESLFYIPGDAFIFSPLETYLILTLLSWLVRAALVRRLDFRRGPLFGAAAVFAVFTLFGLGWGISHGGNVTIALWEVRPILYVPLMLVLSTNLIHTRVHANRLIWLAMAALFVVAVAGIWYYWAVLHGVVEPGRIADRTRRGGAAQHIVCAGSGGLYLSGFASQAPRAARSWFLSRCIPMSWHKGGRRSLAWRWLSC